MFRVIHGDACEELKHLPDSCIQTVITSPPYWGLRDYGIDNQLGAEQTPQEYVNNLVGVFREIHRVLKVDGTVWLNLGDSYIGSGKGRLSDGRAAFGSKQATNKGSINSDVRKTPIPTGLKPKDLAGIPWRVALALQADGWWLRSDIIWHKPNPMPESVTDRPTRAHEYIFLLTKSKNYYYNYKAIAEPISEAYANDKRPHGVLRQKFYENSKYVQAGMVEHKEGLINDLNVRSTIRNKRTVWTITPKPYKGAHFATFPPELITPCILAGSKPGDTVLDPFAGSGTTLLVAERFERHSIGIEINKKYIDLIYKRLKGRVEEV